MINDMKKSNPFDIYQERIDIFVDVQKAYDNNGDVFPGEKKEGEFHDTAIHDKRFRFWRLFIFMGLLILLSRLLYLQMFQGDFLLAVAEKNRMRTLDIKASRGLIFDRNGRALVENSPHFSLELIPLDIPRDEHELNKLIQKVSLVSGKSFEEIRSMITNMKKNTYEPYQVKDNLDFESAVWVKIQSNTTPGIALGISAKRNYLFSQTQGLSHIVGYIGRITEDDLQKNTVYNLTDSIGKTGIEAQYESLLKGERGIEEIEVDSFGRKKENLSYKEPISGKNLMLTVDFEIQKKLEETLVRFLKKYDKTRGAAVALDPRTGEILALVSLPTYDNNLFSQGGNSEEFLALLKNPDNPLFDRVIKGQYPSGSTIKPIIGAAALEEKIITRSTTIQSAGGIGVGKWFFPDWKNKGHGATNITKALAESVNTFFYMIGGGYQNFQGLGLEKLIHYAFLSGMGKPSGIDLPGEAAGLVPTKIWKEKEKNEKWYIGDTYHLSIGQGDILVTPLQVANWTALIANGGMLYQPHLLRRTYEGKKILQKIEPKILQANVFRQENLQIIQEGMLDSVKYGSSKSLSTLPIDVAGKTGTAQFSKQKKDHAWFTSFAPYENPVIVLTILIEEGGEGSLVAGSVAKEFYEWWAEYDQKK